MADAEPSRRAIGKLTFALVRISRHNDADAHDAAASLLEIRLNDLPTQHMRRRFQSIRERLVPQPAKPLEGSTSIPSDTNWLISAIRTLLTDLLLHQKISARYSQGICPLCLKERRSDVLASHVDRWEHAEWPDLWSVRILRILRCLACGQMYSQKEEIENLTEDPLLSVDQSDWTTGGLPSLRSEVRHWAWTTWDLQPETLQRKQKPRRSKSSRRPLPAWAKNLDDQLLKSLLYESYSALNADLLSLPAIGMRAVLDRAMVMHGAAPGERFVNNLSMLEREGLITSRDRETLDVLINAGSAATHARWRPQRRELAAIFDAMEDFLKRAFVIRKKVTELREAVPVKPKGASTSSVVSIDSKPRRNT